MTRQVSREGDGRMATPAPPRWDRRMQQRLARGEEAALGELYDRFASLVHSLAHRVLDDEDAADQITREVFGYIWENPDAYDPKDGSLRSWMATLAQRQSVHRLRRSEAERVRAGGVRVTEQFEARVREAKTAARADFIRDSMPAPLRATLDLAYLQRRDYRQAAGELGRDRGRGAPQAAARPADCCPPRWSSGPGPRRPRCERADRAARPLRRPGGRRNAAGQGAAAPRSRRGRTAGTRPAAARGAVVRPRDAQVAARRLGALGLLRRGDARRRGAPHRLRDVRRRGAAAARRGGTAAPRGPARPRPAAAGPGAGELPGPAPGADPGAGVGRPVRRGDRPARRAAARPRRRGLARAGASCGGRRRGRGWPPSPR